MGMIKSKIGRKFEQKRKAKWVKEKANLVKAQHMPHEDQVVHKDKEDPVIHRDHKVYKMGPLGQTERPPG